MAPLFLVLAIVFNTAGNGFFKASSAIGEFTSRKAVLIGVGMFLGLVNTLCYIRALDEIDLGTAFTAFSAASIVLITVVSVVLFREPVSLQKAAGIAVICAGLLVVWKS